MEAQLVVTRRCNLSCGYCSEFDAHSPEVPYEALRERIDAIHRLRVVNVALLGGEPLLHSRLADVVQYAATRSQVSVTTNGFFLDAATIERLGDAGLANLQLSVDALHPDRDGYVQKTLRSVRPKLERLARRARFDVHVTVVLCAETLPDFAELLRELEAYPFAVSVNLMHDDTGQVGVKGPAYEELWNRYYTQGRPFSFIEQEYGRLLLSGRRPHWKCRAGARFFYVDEEGNVELCSSQRGRVGKNILRYTEADLAMHRESWKGCEEGCSVFCVYRNSQVDNDPVAVGRALFKTWRYGRLRSFRGAPGADASWQDETRHRRLPVVAP